jgi:hypothetical protein
MNRERVLDEEALTLLRGWITPEEKLYTILRHVFRSGRRREISEISVIQWTQGGPRDISAYVGAALGLPTNPNTMAVVVDGGIGGRNTDEGFRLVYSLSYALSVGSAYALRHEWL